MHVHIHAHTRAHAHGTSTHTDRTWYPCDLEGEQSTEVCAEVINK